MGKKDERGFLYITGRIKGKGPYIMSGFLYITGRIKGMANDRSITFNRKKRFILISYLMSIHHFHKCIENLRFKLTKLLCNFVGLCNFFACARPILKIFELETDHLF